MGAQLLQASLMVSGAASPLFYLSPTRSPNAPVRGGVPVLFPQFADSGPLTKHGMVRNALWTPEGHGAYALEIAASDYPQWPHTCVLRSSVRTIQSALRMTLTVTNTGTTTLRFTGGLHPYFEVADVQRSSLSGLQSLGVRDRYNAKATQQVAEDLTWTDQPCERLYASAPPLLLRDGQRRLNISSGGFSEWMVWNPGALGGKALVDLPDADWCKFVCIEPVCVSQPVELRPGDEFEGWMDVEISAQNRLD